MQAGCGQSTSLARGADIQRTDMPKDFPSYLRSWLWSGGSQWRRARFSSSSDLGAVEVQVGP